jgi:hypothetical protein
MTALLWLALIVAAIGVKLLRFGPEPAREILMEPQSWAQFAIYFAVLVAVVKLLVPFMSRIFTGENREWKRVVGRAERGLHRRAGSTRQTRQETGMDNSSRYSDFDSAK